MTADFFTFVRTANVLGSRSRRVLRLLQLLCLLLVLAGCGEPDAGRSAAKGKPALKPLPVKVAAVVRKDMPVEVRAVGSAEAFATVEIKSQLSGIIEQVGFKEGDQVNAGDLLFRIDSRPFTSRLNQALATLAKDSAALELAQKQLERYRPAAAQGFASAEQSDQAQSNVATLQALIKADEAAVASVRLDLENCTIRSPLSGFSGELAADVGNLVKAAADQALVTINQTSPIKVSFSLPEQILPELKQHLASGEMEVVVTVAGKPLIGKLSFIDNRVNQASGTIRLKAVFTNQERQLWPGEFVNVRLRLTTLKDAVVVPTRAVQASQEGDFVYLVGDAQKVVQRPVRVAFSDDDQTVIAEGLEGGETVVTDGQLRLKAGAVVTPLADTAASIAPRAAQ